MRPRVCLASTAVVAGFLASELFAQSVVFVGPQRQVNPHDQRWQECSVGALIGDANHVMVSAQRAEPAPFGAICYGVTLDGGQSFATYTLEGPAGDSGVVLDPASDVLWLSMLGVVDGNCL